MAGILRHVIIFLLSRVKVPVSGADNVSEAFNEYRVVPDIIPVAPAALVKCIRHKEDKSLVQKVVYPGNVEVSLGNELKPTQTLIEPAVDWEADLSSFYTLALVGDSPLPGQFLHWLVGNIPGSDVSRGKALAVYFPPTPPAVIGLYRYVFLVYKQPDYIEFNTMLLNFTTMQLRVTFFINDFAVNNALGNPLFGNIFQERILPLGVLH